MVMLNICSSIASERSNIIVDESIDCNVAICHLKGAAKDPTLAIKWSSSPTEGLVGLYGLNELQLPNFSRIYHVTKRAPLHASKDRGYMSLPGNSYHIFYEYVDGIPLQQFLKVATVDESIVIFTQLLHALLIARKKCGFEHADLHGNNIIIKRLHKPITINYDDVKINTDLIAVMIDYQLSHIDAVSEWIEKSNYRSDVYSLMEQFACYWLKASREDLYEMIITMLRDIYTEDIEGMTRTEIDELVKGQNFAMEICFGDTMVPMSDIIHLEKVISYLTDNMIEVQMIIYNGTSHHSSLPTASMQMPKENIPNPYTSSEVFEEYIKNVIPENITIINSQTKQSYDRKDMPLVKQILKSLVKLTEYSIYHIDETDIKKCVTDALKHLPSLDKYSSYMMHIRQYLDAYVAFA